LAFKGDNGPSLSIMGPLFSGVEVKICFLTDI
jgi:hypothetical protein